MQIKYPENLNNKTCARIAHKCFGRDLITENKSGFVIRPETKSGKFKKYTSNISFLEKEGEDKYSDMEVSIKSYMKQYKQISRVRANGHIPTNMNRYNPATGRIEL